MVYLIGLVVVMTVAAAGAGFFIVKRRSQVASRE